jgi:hypothetical protein
LFNKRIACFNIHTRIAVTEGGFIIGLICQNWARF